MSAGFTWTDDLGGAELTNGIPAPGDRFRGWTPIPAVVGPRREGLGTGIPYTWVFREDYGVELTLAYIPNDSTELADRLQRHLLKGGAVTLDAGDGIHVYTTCYIYPGSTPKLSPPDKQDLRRTLTLSLLNGEQTVLLADYR